MPRPEKVAAVADIKERIESAQAVFVTEFRGLSVKQLSSLRRTLRDSGADYKVVKMTLARRAVDELGIDGVGEHLVGPSALTFAKADPVATAKVLRDLNKENEKLVIKAGILSGKVIHSDQIKALADIEPRDVLLAKIAGAVKAPLSKTAGLMASFTRNAASMFSQLLDKKESGSEPGSAPTPAAAPAVTPVAEEPEPADTTPETEPAETAEPVAEVSTEEITDEPAVTAEEITDEPAATAEEITDEPAATAEEE